MGTWNAGLFSNDTTCDVKDTYMDLLKKQFSNQEAYQKTYDEYEELIGTDEEPLFWYALADTQWNVGRLMPEVKAIALKYIEKKGGIDLWEDSKQRCKRWENTLQKLKDKLETPMPPEKKIRKEPEFIHNPWNVGDVYAYRFHTKEAEEKGLLDKYILLQKIGDVKHYGDICSVVRIYDKVFDSVPTIDVIDGLRILPLISPPTFEECGYLPHERDKYLPFPFECWLAATMELFKKNGYREKYYTFVGNQKRDFGIKPKKGWRDITWETNHLESVIIYHYTLWQGIEY